MAKQLTQEVRKSKIVQTSGKQAKSINKMQINKLGNSKIEIN